MFFVVGGLGVPFEVVVGFGDREFGFLGRLAGFFEEVFPGQVIDVVSGLLEQFGDQRGIVGQIDRMARYT